MTTSFIVRVSASLLTGVLIATLLPAMAAETNVPLPTSKPPVEARNVGVFTGTFVNGMPVYRLPPVSVIAYRKVEVAKMEREEQQARVKQVRAKAAARTPA